MRSSPIRKGWIERSHFADACASLWLEGDLAHLEDLVLHDARMDIRTPTAELVRAGRVLAARRRILAAAPGWALTPEGLAALRGGTFLPEGEGADERPTEGDDSEGRGLLTTTAISLPTILWPPNWRRSTPRCCARNTPSNENPRSIVRSATRWSTISTGTRTRVSRNGARRSIMAPACRRRWRRL
ncbi:hypothetical protein [uncultured Rhodoblastus sp.]|uniref:hypothetical protein n=1 Tax=uncultured Rhodoblastus sp. TaxID=543037 RepID=UPI0025FEF0F2|nr:hypothetical protein [uncultured Rhodoblastus sp.]